MKTTEGISHAPQDRAELAVTRTTPSKYDTVYGARQNVRGPRCDLYNAATMPCIHECGCEAVLSISKTELTGRACAARVEGT